ncbi:unnamed protein product [Arabidopsis halleri]
MFFYLLSVFFFYSFLTSVTPMFLKIWKMRTNQKRKILHFFLLLQEIKENLLKILDIVFVKIKIRKKSIENIKHENKKKHI